MGLPFAEWVERQRNRHLTAYIAYRFMMTEEDAYKYASEAWAGIEYVMLPRLDVVYYSGGISRGIGSNRLVAHRIGYATRIELHSWSGVVAGFEPGGTIILIRGQDWQLW